MEQERDLTARGRRENTSTTDDGVGNIWRKTWEESHISYSVG
jgi:hypothetical protein